MANAVAPQAPTQFLSVPMIEATAPATSSVVPLEIALPNGRVVRVAPGFDPSTRERVLAIASEAER